jgi:hypothetical protein
MPGSPNYFNNLLAFKDSLQAGRGVKGNATGNAALGAAGHDPRLLTRICARGLGKPIRVAFDSRGYS